MQKKQKDLLYIHDSCPNPNKLGSDLVIYRHLKKAEENGWKITMVLPLSSFSKENQNVLPSSWNVITIDNPYGLIKPWMINRFRNLVYFYYYLACKKQLGDLNTSTVISYFWGFNFCGFARYLAKKQNKKLIYFYHDRFSYFIPERAKASLKKLEDRNEEYAFKMLAVSRKLVYNQEHRSKYEVLLPMPNGKYINKKHQPVDNWIYAGNVYPTQVPFFISLANILKKYSTKLTIVADLPSYLKNKFLSETQNVILRDKFELNEEILMFLNETASVILVGYPENIIDMPWAKDCFPSKFIEYCFIDTPIIAFSPKGTAFHEWLHQLKFDNIYDNYDESFLESIVISTHSEGFREMSLTQQKRLIKEVLHPTIIQSQFESFLG